MARTHAEIRACSLAQLQIDYDRLVEHTVEGSHSFATRFSGERLRWNNNES